MKQISSEVCSLLQSPELQNHAVILASIVIPVFGEIICQVISNGYDLDLHFGKFRMKLSPAKA